MGNRLQPVECGSLLPLSRTELRSKAAASRRTPKSPSSCTTRSPKSGKPARFPPNQGKNPCNRASSRQIKASAEKCKLPSSPRHPNPPRAFSSVIGCWMLDVGYFGPLPHLRSSASICGQIPLFAYFAPFAVQPPSPNQGKNPSNQGSSSLIKANGQFFMPLSPDIPHPSSSVCSRDQKSPVRVVRIFRGYPPNPSSRNLNLI